MESGINGAPLACGDSRMRIPLTSAPRWAA